MPSAVRPSPAALSVRVSCRSSASILRPPQSSVSPSSFPRRFHASAPPSLRRVPWVGSPASSVLRGARTPRRPFRLLALARSAVPTRCWETARPPRFLEDLCVRALLSDPGGTLPPATSRPGCCRRLPRRRRLPRPKHFRGSITQLAHSLSTLRSQGRSLCPGPRKTRFRLAATLGRTGLITRKILTKGFCDCFPLSQALPGAPRTCLSEQGDLPPAALDVKESGARPHHTPSASKRAEPAHTSRLRQSECPSSSSRATSAQSG